MTSALRAHSALTYRQQCAVAQEQLADTGYTALAVLGPAGSNSHVLACDIGHSSPQFAANFPALLQHILDSYSAAVLPVVNSIGGLVVHDAARPLVHNRDILGLPNIRTIASIAMPIEHCLVGAVTDNGGAAGQEVHSHPQALRQCSRRISELGLVPIETTSTSAAAEAVMQGRAPYAIASALAAQICELSVLCRDIGDLPAAENITTMAIIGRI